jgi:hypothetical protein
MAKKMLFSGTTMTKAGQDCLNLLISMKRNYAIFSDGSFYSLLNSLQDALFKMTSALGSGIFPA